MNGNRSLFIWRFNQAKDPAALLVEPVAQVRDAILLLGLEVGLMRLGNRIGGQSFDMLVNIDKSGMIVFSLLCPEAAWRC
jgi:hypothetical protein